MSHGLLRLPLGPSGQEAPHAAGGQPELAPEGRPTVEFRAPPVGLGDLAHQLEARAVGGPAVRLQLAAWGGCCPEPPPCSAGENLLR